MCLHYLITPLPAHRFRVRLRFSHPGRPSLYLPVWIPGSYMRRDFARFLSMRHAAVNGRTAALTVCAPSQWRLEGGGEWEVEYEVYARDPSVRGNYLDHQRGFINPCALCVAVEGLEDAPHTLEIALDGAFRDWQIRGSGRRFDNYDHLIDSPLLLAPDFAEAEFSIGGISHRICISGAERNFDLARLAADVEKICRAALEMFGALPPAVSDYHFLLHACDNGYGGLEHRDSTLLMSARTDLPHAHTAADDEGYLRLLGLFGHEYFHTWNIKDLKPADYQPYRLQSEQPSEMLWLFEGFTAYFDDLLLLQAQIINRDTYAALLGKTVAAYWQRRGTARQTLAQSSLEAWTKLYNGGENAPNISTNYYIHGALFAFCLDAWLVEHAATRLSDILAALWRQYRKDEQGIDEENFTRFLLERIPAAKHPLLKTFLEDGLHRCQELPLIHAGRQLGYAINRDNGGRSSECGFRWQGEHEPAVIHLDPDSPAAAAGLGADDRIIAVNREQATPARLQQKLLCAAPGETVELHFFRDRILHRLHFPLGPADNNDCRISLIPQENL